MIIMQTTNNKTQKLQHTEKQNENKCKNKPKESKIN